MCDLGGARWIPQVFCGRSWFKYFLSHVYIYNHQGRLPQHLQTYQTNWELQKLTKSLMMEVGKDKNEGIMWIPWYTLLNKDLRKRWLEWLNGPTTCPEMIFSGGSGLTQKDGESLVHVRGSRGFLWCLVGKYMLVAFFPGFIDPILPTRPDHKRCGQREVPRCFVLHRMFPLLDKNPENAFLGFFWGKEIRAKQFRGWHRT